MKSSKLIYNLFLIIIVFTGYVKAQDTLHLDFGNTQTVPDKAMEDKIVAWGKTLGGKKQDIKVYAYYHKGEFKQFAQQRLDEMYLSINRKVRDLVNIKEQEAKHGDNYQRTRVDIIYTPEGQDAKSLAAKKKADEKAAKEAEEKKKKEEKEASKKDSKKGDKKEDKKDDKKVEKKEEKKDKKEEKKDKKDSKADGDAKKEAEKLKKEEEKAKKEEEKKKKEEEKKAKAEAEKAKKEEEKKKKEEEKAKKEAEKEKK